MNDRTNLERTARALAEEDPVVVLTGAGMSAESGVPTFRGSDGIWQGHRPEELATPHAFEADPRKVWDFYNWRRELIAPLKPNDGHKALVELEDIRQDFLLITQNVDGLHRKAGSDKLVEIHGNLWYVRCMSCQEVRVDQQVPLPYPPTCSSCGGLLRPAVVWFGERLAPPLLNHCREALARSRVLLVIGTSSLVQPAASFAGLAKRAGAFVAEFNLEPTPLTPHADAVVTGPAGRTLFDLMETVRHLWGSRKPT